MTHPPHFEQARKTDQPPRRVIFSLAGLGFLAVGFFPGETYFELSMGPQNGAIPEAVYLEGWRALAEDLRISLENSTNRGGHGEAKGS